MLRRDRWSTVAIALTLALGIGAATATFAVFNTLIFRPTPGVRGQSDILTVLFQPPSRTATAYGSREALEPLRKAATGLEHLAYSSPDALAVTTAGDAPPEFEDSLFVTSQFFSVIGARARLGRLLTDEEADTGSANVAVVSERLWKTRLGGTAGVLGRTLTVNGRPFTVVGVIAEHRGWSWTSSRIGTIDLWLPIGLEKLVSGRDGRSLRALRPPAAWCVARGDRAATARGLRERESAGAVPRVPAYCLSGHQHATGRAHAHRPAVACTGC